MKEKTCDTPEQTDQGRERYWTEKKQIQGQTDTGIEQNGQIEDHYLQHVFLSFAALSAV